MRKIKEEFTLLELLMIEPLIAIPAVLFFPALNSSAAKLITK